MMMMESIKWCLLFSTEAREQLQAAQARLAASAAADTELGKSLARDLEHSLDGMVDYHTCECMRQLLRKDLVGLANRGGMHLGPLSTSSCEADILRLLMVGCCYGQIRIPAATGSA